VRSGFPWSAVHRLSSALGYLARRRFHNLEPPPDQKLQARRRAGLALLGIVDGLEQPAAQAAGPPRPGRIDREPLQARYQAVGQVEQGV